MACRPAAARQNVVRFPLRRDKLPPPPWLGLVCVAIILPARTHSRFTSAPPSFPSSRSVFRTGRRKTCSESEEREEPACGRFSATEVSTSTPSPSSELLLQPVFRRPRTRERHPAAHPVADKQDSPSHGHCPFPCGRADRCARQPDDGCSAPARGPTLSVARQKLANPTTAPPHPHRQRPTPASTSTDPLCFVTPSALASRPPSPPSSFSPALAR